MIQDRDCGDENDARYVELKLIYGRGSVYAVCRCRRSFFAAGSRGICEFMDKQIEKHSERCEVK